MKYFLILLTSLIFSQARAQIKPVEIYKSEELIITKFTENTYQHTSFHNFESYGKVASNGMIFTSRAEAIIFDTTADSLSSVELINYVQDSLQCKIIAIVPTHFHIDCIGGINEFVENEIPVFATTKTIELAKKQGVNIYATSFDNSTVFKIGNQKVKVTFFGEGHTRDNVVAYFPLDKALFGGCLVKSMKAGKGNLDDANVEAWPETVQKVKRKYKNVQFVVPGHGKAGEADLLEYTIQMFK